MSTPMDDFGTVTDSEIELSSSEMNWSSLSNTSSLCGSSSDISSLGNCDISVSDSYGSPSSEVDSTDEYTADNSYDEQEEDDIPMKEFQSLSLLSCFYRNNLSASTMKDIIETLKHTFKNYEDISKLSLTEMMSYIDKTTVKEVHYCTLCKEVFPDDDNIFRCETRNCDGLRYKGPLTSQQSNARQPKQCFVFADVKKQLVDLLQTPGTVYYKNIVISLVYLNILIILCSSTKYKTLMFHF